MPPDRGSRSSSRPSTRRRTSSDTVGLAIEEIGPMVDGSIEVLIVDDGSTDRTPELADALAAADPRVRVHHQPNRGYGGALKAGFENAAGELIGFSDGDLQFDLREMGRLLDRLADERKPVDAVIGYRIKRRDPFHRIFIAKTYNAIVSVAFGLRVRDIDCAMKLFRRAVLEGLRARGGRPIPLSGAADQAERARRADRPARCDALPAPRGPEHRGQLRQDPAHLPRHRKAAAGDVDSPGGGHRHAAVGDAESGRGPLGLLRGGPALAGLEVDVERVDELAEHGELLVLRAVLPFARCHQIGQARHRPRRGPARRRRSSSRCGPPRRSRPTSASRSRSPRPRRSRRRGAHGRSRRSRA